MKYLFFITLLVSYSAFGFVLLDPQFKLKDGAKTKLKVSAEGCASAGVPDAKIANALKEAAEYWNDVPESRLKLTYSGRSAGSLSDSAVPSNEIIVGCGTLPSVQILGSAQNDYTHGSAKVTLNEAVYTGSFNEESLIGTVIHEVGHGLGLVHSKDPASVMTYSPHGWVDRPKYIAQDDIDGVIYLYPNKKNMGGFLGSCSSFAADSEPSFNFYRDFLLGFLGLMGATLMIQRALKGLRRKRNL